jgi:thermitase
VLLVVSAVVGGVVAARGWAAAATGSGAQRSPDAELPASAQALAASSAFPGGGRFLHPLPPELAAVSGESPEGPYRLGEVLVGFRDGVSAASERAIEQAVGATSATRLGPSIKPVGNGKATGQEYLAPMELQVPETQVFATIELLKLYGEVAYAEPNYLLLGSAKPNDPSFGKQWGDENTGQLIPTQNQEEVLGSEVKGIAGDDDKASLAWGTTTGSRSIVIGETDTGVAYEHPDLAANIWSNPGTIGKCAAGTHGYNVLNKTCNPIDEDTSFNGHGTHVAGILGAVGNNGVGVAGMNWQTTILPVRWMNNASGGETSALIEAMQWLVAAKQEGVNVRVVNDSDTFFGTAKSEALLKEVETLGANNILFVTAAGNTGNNNDEVSVQRYPCSYDRSNEICVTATNDKNELPSWANYGPHTVQLGAPGVSIYSTLRKGEYGYLTGGSMAAPQVAGAAALILSVSEKSATELRSTILSNVDKISSLEGKVESGGELDVCKAVPGCSFTPPEEKEGTFGTTKINASKDYFGAERKRVNCYSLPTSGSVTKLSVYLENSSAASGQEVMKGIIYADGSAPEKLLAVSEPITFKTTSTNEPRWYDLPFGVPVNLTAGNYCIGVITGQTEKVAGFRYESVTGSRFWNANSYSTGPTSTFGTAEKDAEQTSLFATYLLVPVNKTPPEIKGIAQTGSVLEEVHGTWANEPTSFTYKWEQCNAEGTLSSCVAISGAVKQTYEPTSADVGHTIRVQETAINSKGSSSPATSAATAVVTSAVPVDKTPPTLSGEARQEKTLKETHGEWTNNPTSYTIEWQRCESTGSPCTTIAAAANKQEYTLEAADMGKKIKVLETAANAGGPAEKAAESALTAAVLQAVPVNKKAPEIEGVAQQGKLLKAVHDEWTNSPTEFKYEWLRCESSGSPCSAIAGATKSEYTPVEADVGKKLKVKEIAKNAGGESAPVESALTAAVLPAVPVNEALPTITGEAQQGKTLTEHNGKWSNSPTEFKYQWLQCNSEGTLASCNNISGATKQEYTAQLGDVGHRLRVKEIAKNAGGESEPAYTEPTAVVSALPVPLNKKPPEIVGEARQEVLLKAEHDEWSNSPTSFSYEWFRCEGATCSVISGATKSEYTPVEADVGKKLKVTEIAENAFGKSEPAESALTAEVLPQKPVDKTLPTITGEATQGQTLKETHGEWTNHPTSYSVEWLQCEPLGNACLPISGASGETYKLTSGDVGHTIRVQEAASNKGGTGAPVMSEPTGEVAPEPGAVPVNETLPAIINGSEAQQGKMLTAADGSWTNAPTEFKYQWLRCNSAGELGSCTPIAGATEQKYTPVEADVNHELRIREIAKNAAGESEPGFSAPTAVVLPAPPAPKSPPTISGEAKQGQTLKETHGEWTNNPTGYSIEWLRCESTGANCNAILGATKAEYTLVEADVGHKLRAREIASNAGGASEVAQLSELSAAVVPLAPEPGAKPPEIEGGSKAQQGKVLKEVHGEWLNNPTEYKIQWLQCSSAGTGCLPIAGATKQEYTPVEGDVNHTLRVAESAKNAGGESAKPFESAPTAVVLPPPPTDKTPPTIEGEVKEEKPLKEVHGEWTNSPTGYSIEWLRCNSEGTLASCTTIAGASKAEYTPNEADVGHRLRVRETASNAGGPAEQPATSEATVVVPLSPPAPETLPTIEGGSKAQQGVLLKEVHAKWTNSPTEYKIEWLRCNSTGELPSCSPIAGATEQKYTPVEADVGHALRVQETAGNTAGPGPTIVSEPTPAVKKATSTFGKTSIGASPDVFASARKRVNCYTMPSPGAVTLIEIYLAPSGKSGQQVMKGIVYADEGGLPTTLLGVTEQFTFHSTNTPGWYEMKFASPLSLPAAPYCIGVITGATTNISGYRYDSVTNSRFYDANNYNAGPSNPFGNINVDSEQMSLYAVYTPS